MLFIKHKLVFSFYDSIMHLYKWSAYLEVGCRYKRSSLGEFWRKDRISGHFEERKSPWKRSQHSRCIYWNGRWQGD